MPSIFIPEFWTCLKRYSWFTFRHDFLAGITVGVVALPLAMAFAIAAGASPVQGLYTAIIAGFLASLLGGSRQQISGPTGAFVVIIYGIIERQGYDGLVLATLLAACLLIIAGLGRLGTLIKFIPYPLVTGFTAGIALIIFSSQLKDLFGLQVGKLPAGFLAQWGVYFHHALSFDGTTACLGLGTLGLILVLRRFFPFIPWGVTAIFFATVAAFALDLSVATIVSRFGEIPRGPPVFHLPDLMGSLQKLPELIPDALVIAFLAGVESLLSAVVADGMTGFRHKSNMELIGQGVANLGSIAFGGIPACGAIARTATNIKTGGLTPVSGMIHSTTLLLIMLCFAPLVGKIPLAALAAVLVMIAWNMSEINHFRKLLKAPRGDVLILLTTFILTVTVDLTVAVEVGMVLAAFSFLKKMTEFSSKVTPQKLLTEGDLEEKSDPDAILKKRIPKGVEVYEIQGPFFFGVASSLQDILHNIEKPPKVFILRMRKVPVIDATGMHALRQFYDKCLRDKTVLFLSGVHGQPKQSIEKFGLSHLIGKENIFSHIDDALAKAVFLLEQHQDSH